jgi:hypothetical protein
MVLISKAAVKGMSGCFAGCKGTKNNRFGLGGTTSINELRTRPHPPRLEISTSSFYYIVTCFSEAKVDHILNIARVYI